MVLGMSSILFGDTMVPSMEVSQNWGFLFWIPHNKDSQILGSNLGSPVMGNYHIE